MRFGRASEALAGEQRMLIDETIDMDLAAIEEELEAQAPVKQQRKRAGRQPLPQPSRYSTAIRQPPGTPEHIGMRKVAFARFLHRASGCVAEST